MTVTVLVADEEGIAPISAVSGVRAVRYDPTETLPAAAADAEVLIPPFLGGASAELLAGVPRLRLLQLLTAGAEAWLGQVPDGVALATARGAHGGSTAEWVLTVLLATYRDIPTFVRAQDAGRWDYHPTETLIGKRVLIVGAGDVASEIEARLRPFEATATLVGRRARDGVHPMDELPDLLVEHDVVVLAVPLTEESTRMADAAFLARMPDGSMLVNAARGPVVDTDALLAELRARRLHAAVDVTDPEPLPSDHPLWQAPNLLLTPHVGGSVAGRFERAYEVAAEQIRVFVAGEDPPNLVRGAY